MGFICPGQTIVYFGYQNETQNETPEKEERNIEQPKSRPSLPDSEDPSIILDWKPDESYETRSCNRIMSEKRIRQQEYQLIKRERQQFEGERRQITQLRTNIDSKRMSYRFGKLIK